MSAQVLHSGDTALPARIKRERPISVRIEGLPDLLERPLDKLTTDEIAQEINREAGLIGKICGIAVREALPHALYVGRLLNEAKSQTSRGKWVKWIDDNITDLSCRTAQVYMQLASADESGQIDLKSADAAHLTIKAFLKEIQSRKAKPENDGEEGQENGKRDEEDVEFDVVCDAYEDAGEAARTKFHAWLDTQYGLEVTPRSLSA